MSSIYDRDLSIFFYLSCKSRNICNIFSSICSMNWYDFLIENAFLKFIENLRILFSYVKTFRYGKGNFCMSLNIFLKYYTKRIWKSYFM